jgi:hypothetical protein
VAGDRSALEGIPEAVVIGTAGGDRLRIGSAEVPLAAAERAWRSLGDSLDVAYPAV